MKKLAACLLVALYPCGALARNFIADITVVTDGVTENQRLGFHRAADFFDHVSEGGFNRLFPTYDLSSTVIANTSYNGVGINVGFLQGGSTQLTFEVPALGINRTFTEATRGQSTDALEHFLRNDINGVASRITEYQVARTATSPLAGNPSSLQGQLVSSTYNTATRTPPAGMAQITPQFAVGVGSGVYRQQGTDVSVINVPISQEFSVDSDNPGRKLILNGQFSHVTIGLAESFQGGLGIGYAHPITDNWSLIPNVSYGVIGSIDLYTMGQILSTSLASNYHARLGDYTFSTVNMFGYFQTLPLSVAGARSSPDINNYVLKNGFFVDHILPFTTFGHKLNMKGIFTDTQFFGSEVFVRQYNEVGFEVNTVDKVEWLDKVTFGLTDVIRLNAKYVFSIENPQNFEGYELGMGYSF